MSLKSKKKTNVIQEINILIISLLTFQSCILLLLIDIADNVYLVNLPNGLFQNKLKDLAKYVHAHTLHE